MTTRPLIKKGEAYQIKTKVLGVRGMAFFSPSEDKKSIKCHTGYFIWGEVPRRVKGGVWSEAPGLQRPELNPFPAAALHP